MTVVTKQFSIQTQGENDLLDITDKVARAVTETNIKNGVVTLFVPGSTGALTTIEYEPGLLKDFPDMLDRIAPKGLIYEHDKMWHDGNGHSHVRASLLGASLSVPFVDKKLTLGTWQQIIFIELDVPSRDRNLVLQIMGE